MLSAPFLLKGKTPRLIDEWQDAPVLWDAVRVAVDDRQEHLLEIKKLVNEYNEREKQIRLREPDLLMVITAGPIAYTRPDGVHIVPLACLKD